MPDPGLEGPPGLHARHLREASSLNFRLRVQLDFMQPRRRLRQNRWKRCSLTEFVRCKIMTSMPDPGLEGPPGLHARHLREASSLNFRLRVQLDFMQPRRRLRQNRWKRCSLTEFVRCKIMTSMPDPGLEGPPGLHARHLREASSLNFRLRVQLDFMRQKRWRRCCACLRA